MMWITPLPVATSAAVSCDVVHRGLVISNCHCQLGALQASHLQLSCVQVRAHDLNNRDDMVLYRVSQILAYEKLLCRDAKRFLGCCVHSEEVDKDQAIKL